MESAYRTPILLLEVNHVCLIVALESLSSLFGCSNVLVSISSGQSTIFVSMNGERLTVAVTVLGDKLLEVDKNVCLIVDL